jgi:ferredoxin
MKSTDPGKNPYMTSSNDQKTVPKNTENAADAETLEVTFGRSGVTVKWDPALDSILELAEANGLDPDNSCRSGYCHTCMCKLVEGEIEYIHDDVIEPDEEGQVLICSSRPKTNVTVDV